MIWTDKNTNGGEVVASQTTGGDFKDLHIISVRDSVYSLVSLLDGHAPLQLSKSDLIAWLNDHRHVPVSKVLGRGQLPENRAMVPVVQIFGLRQNP